MEINLMYAVKYLKGKGISFLVKDDRYIVGLTITKKDRYFRGNGAIISKQAAMDILENYTELA